MKLYTFKTGKEDIKAFPFPLNPEEKTLNVQEQAFCEGLINEEECMKALNSMPSNKTPGTDGLPCEFYYVFGEFMVEFSSIL